MGISKTEEKGRNSKYSNLVFFLIFLDFANMILTAKNKKIKGRENQIGSTVLSKDGNYKTTKFGQK
jgi:hypothetical protein